MIQGPSFMYTLGPEIKLPRRTFTLEEDEALRSAVKQVGERWDKVAELMPNRTARQCQIRWKKYLAPHLRETMWTEEEDRLLLRTIDTIGTKWAKIVKFFPGRSDVSLKNRFLQIRNNVNPNYSTTSKTLPTPLNSEQMNSRTLHNSPNIDTKPKLLETIDLSSYLNTNALTGLASKEDLQNLFKSLGPVASVPLHG